MLICIFRNIVCIFILLSKTNSCDPSLGKVINNAGINIGKEVSVQALVSYQLDGCEGTKH